MPDIYHRVKIYGKKKIRRPFGDPTPRFDKFEENLADQVLQAYGGLSGVQLSALTHQQVSPWHQTWNGKGKNSVIPNDLIQAHFFE